MLALHALFDLCLPNSLPENVWLQVSYTYDPYDPIIANKQLLRAQYQSNGIVVEQTKTAQSKIEYAFPPRGAQNRSFLIARASAFSHPKALWKFIQSFLS